MSHSSLSVPDPSQPDVRLNTADYRLHSRLPHDVGPQPHITAISTGSVLRPSLPSRSSATPLPQQLTAPRRTKPSSPKLPELLTEQRCLRTMRDVPGAGEVLRHGQHTASGTKDTEHVPSEPGSSSPQHGPHSLPGPEPCPRAGGARHQRKAQIKGAPFEGGIV